MDQIKAYVRRCICKIETRVWSQVNVSINSKHSPRIPEGNLNFWKCVQIAPLPGKQWNYETLEGWRGVEKGKKQQWNSESNMATFSVATLGAMSIFMLPQITHPLQITSIDIQSYFDFCIYDYKICTVI